MASELRVNTLKDASGNNSIATSVVFNGSAKAWIDAPDGLASINDSYNISSLDDDGTGDGGLNYTSNMSSTSYAILCGCEDDARTSTMLTNEPTNGTQTTTGVDFATHRMNETLSLTDTDVRSYTSINGDLA